MASLLGEGVKRVHVRPCRSHGLVACECRQCATEVPTHASPSIGQVPAGIVDDANGDAILVPAVIALVWEGLVVARFACGHTTPGKQRSREMLAVLLLLMVVMEGQSRSGAQQ